MFKNMSNSLIKNFICIKAYFYLENDIIKERGSAEKFNFGKGFATRKRFRCTALKLNIYL